MTSDGSDDDDYHAFRETQQMMDRRYPLHDCCEFEDIESLRGMLILPQEESDEDENDGGEEQRQEQHHEHDDSSSDDNDSTEAAHAAAIGHSPQPIRPAVSPQEKPSVPSPVVRDSPGKSEKKGQGQDKGQGKGQENSPDGERTGGLLPSKKPSPKEANAADVCRGNMTPLGGENAETTKNDQSAPPNGAAGKVVDVASTAEKRSATTENASEVDAKPDAKKDSLAAPMEVDEPKMPESHDSGVEKTNGTVVDSTKQTQPASKKTPDKDSPRPKKKVHYNRDIHINERDDDENTPLHIAIHSRKLDHVKLLLEAGASYRMRCDGSWPLHTAISMGAIKKHTQFAYECAVLLHDHGADLTVKDDSQHTALFLACMFNLPEIASYILSDEEGLTTLNAKADRGGNRPLHAAAKYDTRSTSSISKVAAASATGQVRTVPHHHPDGTVVNSTHAIPGFPGKLEANHVRAIMSPASTGGSGVAASSTEALLTQVLLRTAGIEVDATNSLGQTPLHVACLRGNWSVARLLMQNGASTSVADRRGFTPGQLSYKRGMPIPNDLVSTLGGPPESGLLPPTRDLIVDPDGTTMLLTHELCMLHRSCPPIRRDSPEPPPENVRRLHVLVDEETGILKSGEFGSCQFRREARRAAIADVLKVHDYSYIESISQMTSSIPDHPNAIAHLDPDTAVSRWSFEAALRAAGSVCEAVDKVVAGDCRNAFCAVRPPGHHAGPRGIVRCANDPEGGSHGFCLLNNVAIGAAYARCMYRNEGIRKIAIIDFDVHHGNGTEEIIRQLVPTTEKAVVRSPFAFGELATNNYRPWLDETDTQNVFFASTHGYGHRGHEQPGWFYPASGKTQTSEAIVHPAMVEHPSLTDFLLSQTWSRMGEDSKFNCCKIIDVGLELPEDGLDPVTRGVKQRLELRDTYRHKVLPQLREFDPDLIFISAGFDAHRKDTMNFGYVGMVEDDYEWVTEQLLKIANTCCNGRVISVLEGGYKIHGGIISPFARSVASHVRALADGGRSRELYDGQDGEWESQFERHLFERRERKREQERENLRLMEMQSADAPDDPDAPSRKRRRNQVDYRELFKQMQGFANG